MGRLSNNQKRLKKIGQLGGQQNAINLKQKYLEDSFLQRELQSFNQISREQSDPSWEQSNSQSNDEELDADDQSIIGYRIINIANLINFINEILTHQSQCYGKISCTQEISYLRLNYLCKNCQKQFTYQYSEYYQPYKSTQINVLLVFSTLLSGNGFADIQKILSFSSIPFMTKNTFQKIKDRLYSPLKDFTFQNFDSYVKQIKQESIQQDKYSSNGLPSFKVQMDAGWSKVSHGKNFTALSSTLPVIEQSSKKIINIQVINKYCYDCNNNNNNNPQTKSSSAYSQSSSSKESSSQSNFTEDISDKNESDKISNSIQNFDTQDEQKSDSAISNDDNHQCFKNFSGNSPSMENEMSYRAIKYLNENYEINIDQIIHDVDDKSLQKFFQYANYQIQKYECLTSFLNFLEIYKIFCFQNKIVCLMSTFKFNITRATYRQIKIQKVQKFENI